MALDATGLILLVLFFIRGYSKGLIVAVFSLLAVLLGAMCALKLSGAFAAWLLQRGFVTSGWGQLISYVVLFAGVILLVRLVARAIDTSVKAMMLGTVNKLIGGVLYALMAATVWSSLLWIANQMHLIAPETIAASKTYTWFEPFAPWTFAHIGKAFPFVKNIFGDLQHFFNNVNQKLPQHVGPDR